VLTLPTMREALIENPFIMVAVAVPVLVAVAAHLALCPYMSAHGADLVFWA